MCRHVQAELAEAAKNISGPRLSAIDEINVACVKSAVEAAPARPPAVKSDRIAHRMWSQAG